MNLLYFSLTIIFLLVTTSDLAYSQTIEDGEKIEVTNTIDETITMKEIVESIHKSIPIEDGKTDISITINNMINSNEKNSCEIDCEISKEKDIFEWVDFFSDIVSVGVPIIGAVTFYISRRRGDKRRIINSLLIELRQNLRGFATDENGQQRKNEDFAGWNFTTSAFKATVNTGYFAHFRGNTQNSLNDLYYRLETHNKNFRQHEFECRYCSYARN